jgi:hypothetical protein
MSILAPKRKILGLGAKPQLKQAIFPYCLLSKRIVPSLC